MNSQIDAITKSDAKPRCVRTLNLWIKGQLSSISPVKDVINSQSIIIMYRRLARKQWVICSWLLSSWFRICFVQLFCPFFQIGTLMRRLQSCYLPDAHKTIIRVNQRVSSTHLPTKNHNAHATNSITGVLDALSLIDFPSFIMLSIAGSYYIVLIVCSVVEWQQQRSWHNIMTFDESWFYLSIKHKFI
jgi:hypothetical protein